jgi:hypothetical protein
MQSYRQKFDKIRVLFRAPNLELYGIPYEMREGQAPKDLWESQYPYIEICGKKYPRIPGPQHDWIPLMMDDAGQEWLAGRLVPMNACEWIRRSNICRNGRGRRHSYSWKCVSFWRS